MPPFEIYPGAQTVRDMWRSDAAGDSDNGAGGAGLGLVEQGGAGDDDGAGIDNTGGA